MYLAETKLGGSEPVVNTIKKPLLQNLVDFVEFKGDLRSALGSRDWSRRSLWMIFAWPCLWNLLLYLLQQVINSNRRDVIFKDGYLQREASKKLEKVYVWKICPASRHTNIYYHKYSHFHYSICHSVHLRVDQITIPVVSSIFLMIGFRKKNMFSIDW